MAALAQRLIVQEHDSPLGRWRLAVALPHAALAEAVEFLWCIEGGNANEVARILPRGNAHLMFNLGAPQRLRDRGGEGEPVLFREAWISGQQQGYLDVDCLGENAILGVRFHPLGAWRVLGIPQHELADRVLDLDAVLGDAVHGVRQRLLEQTQPAARLSLFEDWLRERAGARAEGHPAVRWALRRMQEAKGQVGIEGLAGESGYSRKHLAQLFQREAGLAPKALARVLRFSHALAQLRAPGDCEWEKLAQDCGYYDQSHLIREFQSLAGHSPGELQRQAALDDESVSEVHQHGAER